MPRETKAKKPSKLTEIFRAAKDAVTPDGRDENIIPLTPVAEPDIASATATLLHDDFAPIEALREAQSDGVGAGAYATPETPAVPVSKKLAAPTRAAAKPSAARKTVTKKAPAKKRAVAKKATVKKAAAKKTVVKKATAAKKTVKKKATAAKTTVAKKTTAAKKSAAKKR